MTIDEDIMIISFVQEHGKKWSEIAQILNKTRTQHQVKNRYYALINKQKKKLNTDE